MAKIRQKKLMGLDERVEYDEDDKKPIFSLASIKSKKGLEKVADVNLEDGIGYESEEEDEKVRIEVKEY